MRRVWGGLLSAVIWACLPVAGAPHLLADQPRPPARDGRAAAAAGSAPVRTAQIDSHGRYPFGMFRGGYRYPFSYPYYRYHLPRQYPFANGPYGPYPPNYGGYSGNMYDRWVYPRPRVVPPPVRQGPPATGVEPPEPPDPNEPEPAGQSPPAAAPGAAVQPTPQPDQQAAPPGAADVLPRRADGSINPYDPSIYSNPHLYSDDCWGDPSDPYDMGNPYGPNMGGTLYYGAFPYGIYQDSMWFFGGRGIMGFGYYPQRNYSYFYGPPSGYGFYGPQLYPQYWNYTRSYGPRYPRGSSINNGISGFYQGW